MLVCLPKPRIIIFDIEMRSRHYNKRFDFEQRQRVYNPIQVTPGRSPNPPPPPPTIHIPTQYPIDNPTSNARPRRSCSAIIAVFQLEWKWNISKLNVGELQSFGKTV